MSSLVNLFPSSLHPLRRCSCSKENLPSTSSTQSPPPLAKRRLFRRRRAVEEEEREGSTSFIPSYPDLTLLKQQLNYPPLGRKHPKQADIFKNDDLDEKVTSSWETVSINNTSSLSPVVTSTTTSTTTAAANAFINVPVIASNNLEVSSSVNSLENNIQAKVATTSGSTQTSASMAKPVTVGGTPLTENANPVHNVTRYSNFSICASSVWILGRHYKLGSCPCCDKEAMSKVSFTPRPCTSSSRAPTPARMIMSDVYCTRRTRGHMLTRMIPERVKTPWWRKIFGIFSKSKATTPSLKRPNAVDKTIFMWKCNDCNNLVYLNVEKDGRRSIKSCSL